jgi:hypothetical protein
MMTYDIEDEAVAIANDTLGPTCQSRQVAFSGRIKADDIATFKPAQQARGPL